MISAQSSETYISSSHLLRSAFTAALILPCSRFSASWSQVRRVSSRRAINSRVASLTHGLPLVAPASGRHFRAASVNASTTEPFSWSSAPSDGPLEPREHARMPTQVGQATSAKYPRNIDDDDDDDDALFHPGSIPDGSEARKRPRRPRKG